ncbi:MAG: PKD domain-containing protein [Candidatus Heimdallarchaeaceae archaeon]
MVSDGFNSDSAETGSFAIDNDLSINDFEKMSSNGTEAVFRFDVYNTFTDSSISDINWTLNSGDGNVIESNNPFSLSSLEEIFIYIYYNYSSTGTYNVTATAYNEEYSESETVGVTI